MSKNTGTENKLNRRAFLKRSLAVWTAVTSIPFIYSILKYLYPSGKKYLTYNIRANPELQKKELLLSEIAENSSKIILFDENEVLIIRGTGNDIRIFDAICTHLDCIVGYRKEQQDIYCSCHGGKYDLNGNVLEGPPKSALKRYEYIIVDDKLIIKS